MLKNGFIDWLTASQFHPKGGLPIVSGGLTVHYDSEGNPRFERNCAVQHSGSYQTSIRVASDGYRVSISGNVGRFQRQDNLFGFGIKSTIEMANRILSDFSLPPFTLTGGISEDIQATRPCYISRLDFTVNYETGSESQARHAIRFLASRAVSRAKRGNAGNDSYWFANTRKMFKAYLKSCELKAHGMDESNPVYQYCRDAGILRFEIELKKRLLSDLKMNILDDITDEKLLEIFNHETAFARHIDRSSDHDFLEHLPPKTRIYAQLWLDGNNVKDCCSRAQMYRHSKILREYGVNIFEPRNVDKFPIRLRVIDLVPASVPDWYRQLHLKVA